MDERSKQYLERVRDGVEKCDVNVPVRRGDGVLVHAVEGVTSGMTEFPLRAEVRRVESRHTHEGPRNLSCEVVVEVRIPDEEATYIHGSDTEVYPLGGTRGKTWASSPLEVPDEGDVEEDGGGSA
jgi:hypothetical protein